MLVYALRDAHQLAGDREPGRLHAAHLAGAWRPAPRARQGVVISDAGEGAAGEPGPQAYQVTDEMIARLLDDPFPGPRRRPIRPNPAVLVPIAHGFAAIATFVLAVTAAST
jgi:hypothetical protein